MLKLFESTIDYVYTKRYYPCTLQKTSSNGDIACKSTVRRGRSGADHVVSTWNQNQ